MSKYLFLSLFLFSTSLFAVVQIAPNEVGLRPGLSGKVQLAINTQRGNTDKDEYNVGGLFSYDNNRAYVTWIDFLSGDFPALYEFPNLRIVSEFCQLDSSGTSR